MIFDNLSREKIPTTTLLWQVDKDKEITFYDSVTGKPLFIAPRGRTFEDFRKESRSHGWPSFRDNEVNKLLFLQISQTNLLRK